MRMHSGFVLEDQGLDHVVLVDAERGGRGGGSTMRFPHIEVRLERDLRGAQRADGHRHGVLGHGPMIGL
jgi:hypothetical protein